MHELQADNEKLQRLVKLNEERQHQLEEAVAAAEASLARNKLELQQFKVSSGTFFLSIPLSYTYITARFHGKVHKSLMSRARIRYRFWFGFLSTTSKKS